MDWIEEVEAKAEMVALVPAAFRDVAKQIATEEVPRLIAEIRRLRRELKSAERRISEQVPSWPINWVGEEAIGAPFDEPIGGLHG